MVIDCDASTSAIESTCAVDAGAATQVVQVLARNTTASQFTIGTFNFAVISDNGTFANPPAGGASGIDANPDFNADSTGLADWACGPIHADLNNDGNPATRQSFISCFNGSGTGPVLMPGGTLPLARVSYDISGVGTVNFHLTNAAIFDDTFTAILATCQASDCYDASASRSSTCTDLDCDGISDALDNCVSIANADQLNSDRNFIANSPPYAGSVNDLTRPNSDSAGDVCDPDDDNDGLADSMEVLPQPCAAASGPTNPSNMDSDGDGVVDGVECGFGADPASAGSSPAFAVCGSNADADGDHLSDRLEGCAYNTDPEDADTDGDRLIDGGSDGCEVASVNGDRVVNSGDQGMLAGGISGAFAYHPNIDINKDGLLNSGDQGLMASFISPPGQCSSPTSTPTITPTATATPLPCVGGSTNARWTAGNGHCYQRFDSKLNFHAAKADCESRDTHLVTLTDSVEQDFVWSSVGGNAYIGLTDEAVEGTWVWVTGEPLGYTNWSTGEPNNGLGEWEEDASALSDSLFGRWNDLRTETLLEYICESTD